MSLQVANNLLYKRPNWWEGSIWLDGTEDELSVIKAVEYTLDPSFPEPVQTKTDSVSKFKLDTATSGPFTVHVRAINKAEEVPDVLLEHDLVLLGADETPTRRETASSTRRTEESFPNGNKAQLVTVPRDFSAANALKILGIQRPSSLILLAGGGDKLDDNPLLTQLFSRGIAPAAIEADALIIDGGTKSGVMALMGSGVADRGRRSVLLGVAPARKVIYSSETSQSSGSEKAQLDPNHSHFVLVDCDDWGCEVDMRFSLARELVPNGLNVVTIVANGGPVTQDEVIRSVRLGHRIIVIEGSGRFADDLAAAWKKKPALPDDPVMAEIIAEGEIQFHPLSGSVKGMERLIIRCLGNDQVLSQAWEYFADYDQNAIEEQIRFQRLQLGIIVLGIFATLLALVNEVGKGNDKMLAWKDWWAFLRAGQPGSPPGGLGWSIIHYLLLALPITLTIFIAAANRFKQGNKWILLRAGAESIKREIYGYRARAGEYEVVSNPPPVTPPADPAVQPVALVIPPSPEQVLSKKVEDITRRTMQTEVNTSALKPYNKAQGFPPYMYAAEGGDDGFSLLSPERYVEVRLGDQLNYYRRRIVKLERKLKRIQWGIYVIAGVGTLLAAINQQVWIALTTALAAGLTTYLGYQQTEATLTKYNQAATDLANIRSWWKALPADDQAKQESVNALVKHTEQILQSELEGWVQQMENALEELRKTQTATEEMKAAAAKAAADAEAAKKNNNDDGANAGGEGVGGHEGEGDEGDEGRAQNAIGADDEAAAGNKASADDEAAAGDDTGTADEGVAADEAGVGNEGAAVDAGDEGTTADEAQSAEQ